MPVVPAVAAVAAHVDRERPGDAIGLQLFGSAVADGGLRPDSDIDLLLPVRRGLTEPERASLTELLLGLSGWRGHAARFPEAAGRRPVELTAVVVGPDGAWEAAHDYQYGEWLRGTVAAGQLPQPTADPDVVVLIATAFGAAEPLLGPPLRDVLAPVDPAALRAALRELIPAVVASVAAEGHQALLALARTVVTLDTGAIVAKDAAAQTVAPRLGAAARDLLLRASDTYLGEARRTGHG